MECAELLAVDIAYDKAVQVLRRLLGVNLPVLAVEMSVAEHNQEVLAYYPLVRQEELKPKVRRGKGEKKTRKKEAIAIAVYTVPLTRARPKK